MERGRPQACAVGVPWPDQVFFYAVVAVDGAGNAGEVSNVVSLYVRSKRSPSTTTSDEGINVWNVGGGGVNGTSVGSVSPLDGAFGLGVGSHRLRVYMAAAVGAGLVALSVAAVAVLLVRIRRRRGRRGGGQGETRRKEYDAEERDTYRNYEPRPQPQGKAASATPTTASTASSSSACGGGDQVEIATVSGGKGLSAWLDSLPRSEVSPNTTSHDLSLDNNGGGGGTLGRQRSGNHTLTKTNPYRHKVLTNGSFLNLKDIPNGGSGGSPANSNNNAAVPSSNHSQQEDSSRPTTSTEDNTGSSQSSESGEFHQHHHHHHHPQQQQQQQQQQQLHRQLQQRLQPPPVDGLSVSTLPVSHNQGRNGGYNIDTSTARAIIDTYSGNLFSGSGDSGRNYHSFRGNHGSRRGVDHRHQQQQQQQQQLAAMSVEVGQSSLDCVDRSLGSYPRVVPAPEPYYEQQQQQQQQFYVRQYDDEQQQQQFPPPPPPVRPRTESVV